MYSILGVEKMAKKKVAYRRRSQNRFSMFLVSLVVVMILVVVGVKSVGLNAQNAEQKVVIEALEEQKKKEEARAEEIDEYRKYTQTKKYVEEVAKERLGLVFEGEIIIKEE